MYTISKEFSFEAAHRLPQLPLTHKCSRHHGHSYRVQVVLRSDKLNPYGFVVDYGELSPLKEYIANELDHRDLNRVFQFAPTAENLAKHLFFWCAAHWPQTLKVGVSETANTWAWFEGDLTR